MTQIPASAVSSYDPGKCAKCGGQLVVAKTVPVTTFDDETPQVLLNTGRCTSCGDEPFLD